LEGENHFGVPFWCSFAKTFKVGSSITQPVLVGCSFVFPLFVWKSGIDGDSTYENKIKTKKQPPSTKDGDKAKNYPKVFACSPQGF